MKKRRKAILALHMQQQLCWQDVPVPETLVQKQQRTSRRKHRAVKKKTQTAVRKGPRGKERQKLR